MTAPNLPQTVGQPSTVGSGGGSGTQSPPRSDAGAAAASSGAGSGQAPGAVATSWGTNERRSAAAVRRQQLKATTERSKKRIRVKLQFTLPEAQRIFLIVRGPAPSCRIAGVIPFRARQGRNTATFAGRVRGRSLEPGVYMITISPKRRLVANAPTEYVRVESPRRTLPLGDRASRPTCTAAQAFAADPTARFLVNERRTTSPVAPQARPAQPEAPLRPPPTPAAPVVVHEDVDDGAFDALPGPAEIGDVAGEAGGAVATIVVVLLAGLLLLGMLWFVARFMRGTWNP